MDKLIGLLVDQITKNKHANSLFAVIAGAFAVWALTGGTENLFDGSTVRKLEAKALVQVDVLAKCEAATEKAKKEVTALKNALVDTNTQHDRDLDTLRSQISDLKAENLLLSGQNDVLRLLVTAGNSGNVSLPDNRIPPDLPAMIDEHPQ